MELGKRLKRIAVISPIAIILLIHTVRADGWAATLPALAILIGGGTGLVILFKLLGWM